VATTVNNSLSGPAGAAPSASSLSATARAGTVGIVAPERAVYSDTRTVHGLTSVRVDTGHHRANSTPRLEVALPAAPWHLRWYVYLPGMQAAGYGTNECRWVARLGPYGLVLHETAAGNVGARLQPSSGLASAPLVPAESGVATALGQWLRVEATSTATTTTVRVYAAHATASPRIYTWSVGLAGSVTAELTAYRYRRGVLLQQGATDANSGGQVTPRQNQLITLGYLAPGGADGQYGPGTAAAVAAFQTAYGLVPVDGEIGPETGAALDLAVAEALGDPLPPPTYVSHVAVSDSAALGPAAAPTGDAVAALAVLAQAAGTKSAGGTVEASLASLLAETGGRGGNAEATLGAAGTTNGTKHTDGTVEVSLGTITTAHGTKHASGTAVASLGLVGTVEGTKHTDGTAEAALATLAEAHQLIEPVPPVEAIAYAAGQVDGTATPTARIAGTAYRTPAPGGSAHRR
jgi:hypothetical protein